MNKKARSKVPLKSCYIDPLTDFGFKLLFGIARSKPYLIDFINAFRLFKYRIVDIRYIEREQLGRTAHDRKAVFDIHCIDEKGTVYVIELQRLLQPFFLDRSLYYSTFPIQSQAAKGKWNYQLHDTITIGILEFRFDSRHRDQWLHRVNLVDVETGEVFNERLRYVYVELPKFRKKEGELKTRLEWWLFVLKSLSKLKEIPVPLRKDRIFKSFFMTARVANLNQKAYLEYVESQKDKWDMYAIKQGARKEGREEGVLQVARAMKSKGIDIHIISETTGLSVKEINKL